MERVFSDIKHPFFMDFVHGIVGSYIDDKPAEKEGERYVYYVPLNGVRTRKLPIPVPKEKLIGPLTPDIKDQPGAEEQIYVVTEDAKGNKGLKEEIEDEESENVSELRDQIRDLKRELSHVKDRSRIERDKEKEEKLGRVKKQSDDDEEDDEFADWG